MISSQRALTLTADYKFSLNPLNQGSVLIQSTLNLDTTDSNMQRPKIIFILDCSGSMHSTGNNPNLHDYTHNFKASHSELGSPGSFDNSAFYWLLYAMEKLLTHPNAGELKPLIKIVLFSSSATELPEFDIYHPQGNIDANIQDMFHNILNNYTGSGTSFTPALSKLNKIFCKMKPDAFFAASVIMLTDGDLNDQSEAELQLKTMENALQDKNTLCRFFFLGLGSGIKQDNLTQLKSSWSKNYGETYFIADNKTLGETIPRMLLLLAPRYDVTCKITSKEQNFNRIIGSERTNSFQLLMYDKHTTVFEADFSDLLFCENSLDFNLELVPTNGHAPKIETSMKTTAKQSIPVLSLRLDFNVILLYFENLFSKFREEYKNNSSQPIGNDKILFLRKLRDIAKIIAKKHQSTDYSTCSNYTSLAADISNIGWVKTEEEIVEMNGRLAKLISSQQNTAPAKPPVIAPMLSETGKNPASESMCQVSLFQQRTNKIRESGSENARSIAEGKHGKLCRGVSDKEEAAKKAELAKSAKSAGGGGIGYSFFSGD